MWWATIVNIKLIGIGPNLEKELAKKTLLCIIKYLTVHLGTWEDLSSLRSTNMALFGTLGTLVNQEWYLIRPKRLRGLWKAGLL